MSVHDTKRHDVPYGTMASAPRGKLGQVLLLAVAHFLAGCGDDDRTVEDVGDGGMDAGSGDSGTTRNDAGVECCIPSPQPDCTMRFGGAKRHFGACTAVADGMPAPNDPAWHLANDEFGCPTWVSKGARGPCCGSRPPPADAGPDPVYMCYPDPISVPE